MSKETQLALAEQPQAITPMGLIEMAAARGASIEQMAQLFELKLRVEADEAKKAYHLNFAAFKAEAVRIVKNVTVSDGPLKGKAYADLFGVCNAIIPALSKHGLSHAWKLSRDEKDWMEVTCTITHSLGHSESVSMGSAPDTGPGRNAIQARGSAKSYLERYTLLAATGMAAAGADNDGAGGKEAAKQMPEPEFLEHRDWILNAADREELKRLYLNAVAEAEKIGDKEAITAFATAKNARFRQVQ